MLLLLIVCIFRSYAFFYKVCAPFCNKYIQRCTKMSILYFLFYFYCYRYLGTVGPNICCIITLKFNISKMRVYSKVKVDVKLLQKVWTLRFNSSSFILLHYFLFEFLSVNALRDQKKFISSLRLTKCTFTFCIKLVTYFVEKVNEPLNYIGYLISTFCLLLQKL